MLGKPQDHITVPNDSGHMTSSFQDSKAWMASIGISLPMASPDPGSSQVSLCTELRKASLVLLLVAIYSSHGLHDFGP